jgi:hypothetical protein
MELVACYILLKWEMTFPGSSVVVSGCRGGFIS